MKIFNYIHEHKKILLAFGGVFVLFLVLRIPGLSLPYHQDEMKTAFDSIAPSGTSSGLFHPPLTDIFFKFGGHVFGPGNLRLFILLFASLEAILFALMMKGRAGKQGAFFSFFLFSVCMYSVLASLMVDTDGAILPVFYAAALLFYDMWQKETGSKKILYFGFFAAALIGGLLVKLSFIIILGVFIIDYLFEKRFSIAKKDILKILLGLAGFFVVFTGIIFLAHTLFPSFNIDGMMAHARSFVRFGGRNYGQIIIQAIKAFFYLSPLLILSPFLLDKNTFKQSRIFFIHLALGFIFYFVLFDFSQGALDKYLMFSVIPLSALAGLSLRDFFQGMSIAHNKRALGIGVVISAALFALNFLPHSVLPLYPKTDWFKDVFHLKWNILFPLTGGSGPLGFYMSFLYIVLVYLVSIALILISLFKKQWRKEALIIFLLVGVAYNAVFIEELLYGKLFGSAPSVLKESLSFIERSPEIKKVITYNSSGSYELRVMGKDSGRFYAVPEYVEGHKILFANHHGHFLVVRMPEIYAGSFYDEFFAGCKSVFETSSGKIRGDVYDCTNK